MPTANGYRRTWRRSTFHTNGTPSRRWSSGSWRTVPKALAGPYMARFPYPQTWMRAWCPYHQRVVGAGSRDLKTPFDVLLPLHLTEIDPQVERLGRRRVGGVGRDRR